MSYEDDFIDWVAENRTGFLGGLVDEGVRELAAVGIHVNYQQPEESSMPRSTQSRETGIINYFKSTDLAIALVVLGLVKEAVSERQARSNEAKARAVKAPKPTTDRVSALGRPVAQATAPAAPKKSHKKKKVRASRAKSPVKTAAQIEQEVAQQDGAVLDQPGSDQD